MIEKIDGLVIIEIKKLSLLSLEAQDIYDQKEIQIHLIREQGDTIVRLKQNNKFLEMEVIIALNYQQLKHNELTDFIDHQYQRHKHNVRLVM